MRQGFTIGFILMFLPCCALFFGKTYTKPEVKFTGLILKKANFKTLEVEIELQVQNPNAFSIDLNDIEYKAFYKGKTLATGSKDRIIVLEGQQGRYLLPLTINLDPSLGVMALALAQQKQTLEFEVTAMVATPIGTYPMEYRGEKHL